MIQDKLKNQSIHDCFNLDVKFNKPRYELSFYIGLTRKRSRLGFEKSYIRSYGYLTEEEAFAEAHLLRFAIDSDKAKHWVSPNKRSLHTDSYEQHKKDYVNKFAKFGQKTQKYLKRSRLNAAQKQQLMSIQKHQRDSNDKLITELEYSKRFDKTVYSHDDILRYKRSLFRRAIKHVKCRALRQRIDYLRRNLQDILKLAEEYKALEDFLVNHIQNDQEEDLIVLNEEFQPRSKAKVDDEGDTQYMQFSEDDYRRWEIDHASAGPFYDKESTPDSREEAFMTAKEIASCQKRIAKDLSVRAAAMAKCRKDKDAAGLALLVQNPVDETVRIVGWLGKPKGILQILYERGLWKPGMGMKKSDSELRKLLLADKPIPNESMCCDVVLHNCPDFKNYEMHSKKS